MSTNSVTTDEILARLTVLYRHLNGEGLYVKANTVSFAIEKIERLRAENEAFRSKLAETLGKLMVANAENERLTANLGMAHADLYGTQDGALLRDYKAALERAEAENERLRTIATAESTSAASTGKALYECRAENERLSAALKKANADLDGMRDSSLLYNYKDALKRAFARAEAAAADERKRCREGDKR